MIYIEHDQRTWFRLKMTNNMVQIKNDQQHGSDYKCPTNMVQIEHVQLTWFRLKMINEHD
jgi:hypothetical protein